MTRTGEHNSRSTLTTLHVCEGRRRVGAGEPVAAVARDLKVSETALAQAVRGKSWGHLNAVVPPVRTRRRPPRREYSPDDRRALKWFARRMDRDGAMVSEIARCMDVNQNTVYSWLSGRR